MGIIRKSEPVGLESVIDRLQVKLYSELKRVWKITNDDDYMCYPKVYRNQSDTRSYVAEWYNGNDYVEAYFDDSKSATSFFGITRESNVSQPENVTNSFIHLVFFVDLSKVKPLPAGFRNDEAARIDVQKVLDTYGTAYGFQIYKMGTGIDYALSEYPGSRKEDGLKFRDQHPIHCFRFDLSVWYQPTQVSCLKK